jgi:hypothetical protein
MKITSTRILLFCSLTACNTLNAQLSDSPKPPPLPPGVKEQVEKMKKMSLNKAGIITDESLLTSFVKKIKTIKIGEDTPDDVIGKIGAPKSRSTISGTEQFIYMFMMGNDMEVVVTAQVQIGTNGKVSCVKVDKSGRQGVQELYVKGTWELPGMASTSQQSPSKNQESQSAHFPLKDNAPENPTEGQIYFNKTDKHFYGWDGTSWLKLDSKP